MVFSLFALWWRRIRGLWKLPDERDWVRGKLGLVLMSGAMLSKSLIQVSVEGWGHVPCLLFTWGQTIVQVEKITLNSFKRSHACTVSQGPLLCIRPLLAHGSTGDSWALMGKSRSVSCGVTVPFLWGVVCMKFCLCPPGVYFPVLCKFWQLYGRLMVTSSKRVYALSLQQSTADPYLHRRCSDTVLSQSLWSLWVLVCTRFVWAFWASLEDMGFDSKHNFAPSTILLGLLCPCTWGISSQSLQHCTGIIEIR